MSDDKNLQAIPQKSAISEGINFVNPFDDLTPVKKDTRLRVWVGLFYPESTKDNWQQILSDNFVCCSVSPLHDRDTWDEDVFDTEGNKVHEAGDRKKPHYHIVFRFNGSKSYMQVWDILKMIALDPAHCPPPKIPRGDVARCVQYHIHYNDKTKAQYKRSDIISINGFDVDRCFLLNTEQEDQLVCALQDYISKRNITELWDLFSSLRISRLKDPLADEMFTYVRKHTILINTLISSRRNIYKARKEMEELNNVRPENTDFK